MKNSSYYKSTAKECLKGKWGVAIAVSLVAILASSALNFIPVVGSIVGLVITGQLVVGEFRFYSRLVRKEDAKFADMFEDFQHFLGSFAAYLLQTLLLFLWAFLLIIPAIIKSYSYAMTLYLKHKHPEMRAYATIKLSSQIMQGRRWKLFCLQCSFIGWILLGCITFGIAFLYVGPYMQASMTKFYEDAYNEYNNIQEDVVTEVVVEQN